MSTLKRNPLVNLAKAAVGLPTTASSCCGFGAAIISSNAKPASAEAAEQAKADSCCGSKPAADAPSAPDASTPGAATCQCGN